MDIKRIGVASGLLGVVLWALQIVPGALLRGWTAAGVPGGMPLIGTAGTSITVYILITEEIGPLGTLFVAIGFGYYLGGRMDVAREYRRFLAAIGVGSSLGIGVLLGGVFLVTDPTRGSALIALAMVFEGVVSVALVLTAGAFAGAAITTFQAHDPRAPEATEADTAAPPSAGSEPSADRSDTSSRRMRYVE